VRPFDKILTLKNWAALFVAAFSVSTALAQSAWQYSAYQNTTHKNFRRNPFIAENIATHFGIKYKPRTPVYRLDTEKGTFSYQPGGALIPNHTYLSFAEVIVAQWLDSPPHRANLLSQDAVQLGCGAYFFRDQSFYNMPTFVATQNFQLYEKIIPGKATDRWP